MHFLNKIRNLILKVYHWALHISDKPCAYYVLSVVAFTESSFFIVPPDAMLIPMALARPKRAFLIATVAGVFSVLGGLFGYFLGYTFYKYIGTYIIEHFHYQDQFNALSHLYNKHNYLAIFIGGFTPIPYKLITLFSGFVKTNIWVFLAASITSRFGRFYLIASVIYLFGDRAKIIIEKHIGKFTLLITFILVALYLYLTLRH